MVRDADAVPEIKPNSPPRKRPPSEKKKYVAASLHLDGASLSAMSGMGSADDQQEYSLHVDRCIRVRPSANLTSTGFSIARKALK